MENNLVNNSINEENTNEDVHGETNDTEMGVNVVSGDVAEDNADGIPGTAQIRKLGTILSSMELLELSAKLAEGGYDKKLFSLLSRVYGDKKHFTGKVEAEIIENEMKEKVQRIIASNIPTELKMQTFTSFRLPVELLPEKEVVSSWIRDCSVKRQNIAVYFLADYPIAVRQYEDIIGNKAILKAYLKEAKQLELIHLFAEIFVREEKEFITGAIRMLAYEKRHFKYPELSEIKKLTQIAFDSKQVFFTTKLMYCVTFNVPRECLPDSKELYDILKICINYDEKSTKEFSQKYDFHFNSSPEAMCKYYLGNKKSQKEKTLVSKFAANLVNVEDEVTKSKLLHFAFKRGGLFRMYAGCMQDGGVNEEKQKRFRYTEEQIAWVKTLPGLK